MKHTLTASDLAHFYGTGNYYKHGLNRNAVYTDGVKYVGEKAGAYWLIDEICLGQANPKVKRESFQTWTLKVSFPGKAKASALLTCDDGNKNIVYTKHIEFTDFPLGEIKFYFVGGVLMLTSEY